MINLNILETFRTKEELLNYFDLIGQSITEEEIENLKKGYEEAENATDALTLKQLDDIAGGTLSVKIRVLPRELDEKNFETFTPSLREKVGFYHSEALEDGGIKAKIHSMEKTIEYTFHDDGNHEDNQVNVSLYKSNGDSEQCVGGFTLNNRGEFNKLSVDENPDGTGTASFVITEGGNRTVHDISLPNLEVEAVRYLKTFAQLNMSNPIVEQYNLLNVTPSFQLAHNYNDN